jgi:multidrug efflux system outer membrane protein
MKEIILLLVICLISGCAIGPNFNKPFVETLVEYRMADSLQADSTLKFQKDYMTESQMDSAINLKWWKLFIDPVLDTLVTAALYENKDIQITASRIEEARAFLGFTKADAYPKLGFQAGASRGDLLLNFKTDDINNNFFIAPTLNWELDFWGKFRRSNEAARAELIASEYSHQKVQISLISEVVGTYFLLLDYHQRLEISKWTLESRLHSLDIIQKRFDKGIIPEIDLNQAQIQKEIAAASIPFYERLIAKTENTLSILLGRLPGEITKGMPLNSRTYPPEIPVGLPSSLLERRPDIAEAEYFLKAQNARIGVAASQLLPAISLTGTLGIASDELKTMTTGDAGWSVGANLAGPLFEFGKNLHRIDIEKERTKQAQLNYENMVLFAFKEVEDALVEIYTYKNQLAAVERQYKAAENAAVLSRERYDKGVASYLEVLDSERTLFNAELQLSELRQLYHNAYVELYKALGGGWISEEEMEKAEN